MALVAAAGCSKPQSESSGGPSAAPAASAPLASAPVEASPSALAVAASPLASGEASVPTSLPAASPVPNLLSTQNGTILRAYPTAADDPANAAVDGFRPDTNAAGPWVFVYELPGAATLSRLSAQLPAKGQAGQGATVTFAISTTSATSGFSDAGTISAATTSDEQSVTLNGGRARWIRVTANRTGDQPPFNALGAYGTVAPPPAIAIAGTYVQFSKPYDQGGFRATTNDNDPWFLQVVTIGSNGINGERCFDGHLGEAYPGSISGRTWQWHRSNGSGWYVANDEGSMLVGTEGTTPSYWVRSPLHPKWCAPQVFGTGRTNVLVLEDQSVRYLYPVDNDGAKNFPALRFSRFGAALLDQSLLASASTAMLNGVCEAPDMLAPAQTTALMQWVQQGHKLTIHDSDVCKKTNYSFLPYSFLSDNPGAQGAKGDRLILVEDDSLGTSDKSDKAHFFDPQVYAANSNQLGDANTVTTQDPHWCGHLFGTNVNHVNGFMQMYALYGSGLIIYNGFDHDDGDVPSYQRVRQLELAQPVPADLPCTQKASLAFVIQPNRDGAFVPGKATTLPFAMELLANQGWKGHVNVTTTGDFKAAVTPSAFDVNGGTQPLKIAVSIPASAKPGQYAIIVNGAGGAGGSAQATIQLHAAVPLVKQIKSQRRIRIYGIHFDVDKATIKPQSEPVIAQIAAVMNQNSKWRFRVEGHTDSDGGLAHNQVLSQNRAAAVVNDLVKRYHIARSRLVPMGFGYSKPVAPNTTPAGKALNRRVELFLLNP